MFTKTFDFPVKFKRSKAGNWYPIVKAVFFLNDGRTSRWPLLLDTGAEGIVLHTHYKENFPHRIPETFHGLGKDDAAGDRRAIWLK